MLVASLDALLRVASNPFFPYMIGRIEEGIDRPAITSPAAASAPPAGRKTDGEVVGLELQRRAHLYAKPDKSPPVQYFPPSESR